VFICLLYPWTWTTTIWKAVMRTMRTRKYQCWLKLRRTQQKWKNCLMTRWKRKRQRPHLLLRRKNPFQLLLLLWRKKKVRWLRQRMQRRELYRKMRRKKFLQRRKKKSQRRWKRLRKLREMRMMKKTKMRRRG